MLYRYCDIYDGQGHLLARHSYSEPQEPRPAPGNWRHEWHNDPALNAQALRPWGQRSLRSFWRALFTSERSPGYGVK